MPYLLKTYVTKDGNIYYPGEYNASNPLPEAIAEDPIYVKPDVEHYVRASRPEVTKEIANPVKKGETSFEESPGLSGELKVNEQKREGDMEIKPKVTEEKAEEVNINTASYDEIVALKGVGKSIANKVIEYREYSPFISYSDLTERVPLSFGNSWEKLPITFDK